MDRRWLYRLEKREKELVRLTMPRLKWTPPKKRERVENGEQQPVLAQRQKGGLWKRSKKGSVAGLTATLRTALGRFSASNGRDGYGSVRGV